MLKPSPRILWVTRLPNHLTASAGARDRTLATVLGADMVLVAVGLVPNVELAQSAGLSMGNGIKVNEFCQTSDPHIFAVGDCTEFPLPFLEGARTRLESVPNAVEQARAAASFITGAPKPYNLVPWFWSDQYNLKRQSVGLSQGHDQTVIRQPSKPDGFLAFYLKGGHPVAADCVNAMMEFNVAKRLITEKFRWRLPHFAIPRQICAC